MSEISVIIPIFNEERTISSIIEIVRSWGRAKEIIVVDDGSTDKTASALKQFQKDICLIRYKHNHGKGYAVAKGIVKSSGDILLFLDGDMVGLTHRDLRALVTPVVCGKADMVLGLARFWSAGWRKNTFSPFDDITGERVVLRKNIMPFVSDIATSGYGMELFLNDVHKDKQVISVKLPHVFVLGKLDKQSMPDAMLAYIKEAGELMAQLLRQQTGDISPNVKRVFVGIQNYLKQALGYFQ